MNETGEENPVDKVDIFRADEIDNVLQEIEHNSPEQNAILLLTERKLRKDAEAKALFDKLTGLPNREGFEFYLKTAQSHAERASEEISIAVIDVDNFKKINDELGHNVGDKALRLIVNALQGGTRESDILGRTGGDEFSIVFTNTNLEQAKIAAERIQEDLKDLVNDSNIFDIPAEANIGVSIGVAQHKAGTDIKETIERADQEMYSIKRGKGTDS